jgi:hypothetical protein
VATVRLPDNPSLTQLRKLAKDIRDLARAGDEGVLALVGEHHPDGAGPVPLAGAQLVVARHHGFPSWAALKRHVETIEHYRRFPDQVNETGAAGDGGPNDIVGEFLLLACLRYGGDDVPARWERARRMAAEHPAAIRASVHAAAAAADPDALATLLADAPGSAAEPGGPYRWEPLLYLAYARHDPTVTEAATLETARLLLAAGADPNAGYLWHGLIPPFTAVTGALGGGEGAAPPHPHGYALARALLAAGADANDGQTLYNRQFTADDSHLELLLSHGLGRGDGGPWRARLGDRQDSPDQLVRGQLWWALTHNMAARVRLLAAHGADIATPFAAPDSRAPSWRVSYGKTPAELAALCGCPAALGALLAAGAPHPELTGADALIAAVLAGDAPGVEELRPHAAEARRRRPGLAVWAAARRSWGALPVLADLGFDLNALGRSDVPMEQRWESALHCAAGEGEVDGVRLLLELGADPNVHDARFDATPLGWAEHLGQPATAALLRPVTSV